MFSLNTVVGFACAIGVDMGFNSGHHHEGQASLAVHNHQDGKKHGHHEKDHHHKGLHGGSHHGGQTSSEERYVEKDNCCTDSVRDFQQLDKSRPDGFILVHPVFTTAFLAVFYQVPPFHQTDVVKDIRQFLRSYHPPIDDIRVAIQSFQI